MTLSRTLLLALVVAAGCARPARFTDRMILWRDSDDAPVPLPPPRRNPEINWQGERDALWRPANRALSLDYGQEAVNVNALDEVPDSTWFFDRRRDRSAPDDQPRWHPLTAEQVERGAVRDEDVPEPPFVIVEGKSIGSSEGIIVNDARGVRYLLKLDPPDLPQLVTSTQAVAGRLAWAAGWNVPAELLIDVAPDELRVAPGAFTKDDHGRRVPFDDESLRVLLAVRLRDGRMRALASRWIEGRSLGWFDYLGRDPTDHNDRVRHEDRRDLRGFGTWCAWVDDIDTFANNTLDTYVGDPGRGHVIHYQQDVGKSFGVFSTKPVSYWMGSEGYLAAGRVVASLGTLGLAPRPWLGMNESTRARLVERWPQLGFFEADHFQPRKWQPIVPNAAFSRQTRRDHYWGAKRVAMFTPDEIRGAIAAGEYPPEVGDHLFDVLWRRREKLARAYFSETTPLDHFHFAGDKLCFDDLWITTGLGGEAGTRYEAREGRRLLAAAGSGCVALAPRRGYRVIELRVQRPGERHFGAPVRVHIVEHATRRNIVGIER